MNLGVENAAVTTCTSAVKTLKGTDQRRKQCNQKTNSLELLTRQLKAIPEGYLWLYPLRLPLANFLRECCSRDFKRSMHHSKWSHAHTPRENMEFGSASPCQPIAPKRIPPWEMDKGGSSCSMTWANHANHQENENHEKWKMYIPKLESWQSCQHMHTAHWNSKYHEIIDKWCQSRAWFLHIHLHLQINNLDLIYWIYSVSFTLDGPRTLRKSNHDSKWVQKPIMSFPSESNPHPNVGRWPCDRDRCLTRTFWPQGSTQLRDNDFKFVFTVKAVCLCEALSILNPVLTENLQELPCRNLNA